MVRLGRAVCKPLSLPGPLALLGPVTGCQRGTPTSVTSPGGTQRVRHYDLGRAESLSTGPASPPSGQRPGRRVGPGRERTFKMENTHETARPSVASTGLDNSSRSQGCDVLVELRNVGGLAATPVTWHLDRAASASGRRPGAGRRRVRPSPGNLVTPSSNYPELKVIPFGPTGPPVTLAGSTGGLCPSHLVTGPRAPSRPRA